MLHIQYRNKPLLLLVKHVESLLVPATQGLSVGQTALRRGTGTNSFPALTFRYLKVPD